MNGTSNEDQKTCLKEAAAARDAEKKGQLKEADDHYRKNAMARCAVFTGEEAKDCRARAGANGIVSGSVAGGGVLRESDTVTQTGVVLIPVQPAPAKP